MHLLPGELELGRRRSLHAARRLPSERQERAVVLLPRGDAQSEVVVIRIWVLVGVEHGLLLEDLEQPAEARGLSSRTSGMATRMAGVDCRARSRHQSRQSVAIRAQEAGMTCPW
jgi:hypothetical protein